MKIYILVEVSYDPYRFESNLYAHTNKEKVIEFINNHDDKLPLFEYEEEEPDEFWKNETRHWWIQVFNCE